MKQYIALLKDVLANGTVKTDRTGTGTIGVFGRQVRYDLSEGMIPLITTKKIYTKGVIAELLWMLAGDTNIEWLNEHKVRIWDEWAKAPDGELGPIYGAQWRGHGDQPIDQFHNLLKELETNPSSRRLIVDSWSPRDLDAMALAPCHCLFQFNVRHDDAGPILDCQLYQRSADIFLGVPFNMFAYGLLTQLVAEAMKMRAGEFIHTFGDLHLYRNHVDQAYQQLSRAVIPTTPYVTFSRMTDGPGVLNHQKLKWALLNDPKLLLDKINIHDYKSHPAIKAPVSV